MLSAIWNIIWWYFGNIKLVIKLFLHNGTSILFLGFRKGYNYKYCRMFYRAWSAGLAIPNFLFRCFPGVLPVKINIVEKCYASIFFDASRGINSIRSHTQFTTERKYNFSLSFFDHLDKRNSRNGIATIHSLLHPTHSLSFTTIYRKSLQLLCFYCSHARHIGKKVRRVLNEESNPQLSFRWSCATSNQTCWIKL